MKDTEHLALAIAAAAAERKRMQPSQKGIALTEQSEGCRLEAYQDSVGVWTIGYGHTRGVKPGMKCTQVQAVQWLRDDLKQAVADVNAAVKVPLTQGQFDALEDFVFNLGGAALRGSTLLRLLNAGDYLDAAKEFEKWDHAGSQVLAGLLRRRIAEQEEFES